MKARTSALLIAVVGLNLALSICLLATRNDDSQAQPAGSTGVLSKSDPDDRQKLAQAVAGIRSEVAQLQETLAGVLPPTDSGSESEDAIVSLADRLSSMEQSINKLQSAMNGITLESSSAERDALFLGEDGHLKADEYAAAEKWAVAGEGYLKFLEAHPDHPDHRNILERARNAFNRAGYIDKAIWAQKEMMRIYPESRATDLMTLSRMEKNSGRYGTAAQHAEEAATLDKTSNRYWDLLYAACYTQLDQGPQAGLDYYRTVQRQIIDAGFGDGKLGEQARENIEHLERQVADGQ